MDGARVTGGMRLKIAPRETSAIAKNKARHTRRQDCRRRRAGVALTETARTRRPDKHWPQTEPWDGCERALQVSPKRIRPFCVDIQVKWWREIKAWAYRSLPPDDILFQQYYLYCRCILILVYLPITPAALWITTHYKPAMLLRLGSLLSNSSFLITLPPTHFVFSFRLFILWWK